MFHQLEEISVRQQEEQGALENAVWRLLTFFTHKCGFYRKTHILGVLIISPAKQPNIPVDANGVTTKLWATEQ